MPTFARVYHLRQKLTLGRRCAGAGHGGAVSPCPPSLPTPSGRPPSTDHQMALLPGPRRLPSARATAACGLATFSWPAVCPVSPQRAIPGAAPPRPWPCLGVFELVQPEVRPLVSVLFPFGILLHFVVLGWHVMVRRDADICGAERGKNTDQTCRRSGRRTSPAWARYAGPRGRSIQLSAPLVGHKS
jgi:hypothetical protein